MELRRLLDEHADPDVRRALRAGACLEPPPGSEEAVWASIATALTVTAVSGAAHAAASPGSAMGTSAGAAGHVGLAGLAKSLAVGVGATVLALGGVAAIRENGSLARSARGRGCAGPRGLGPGNDDRGAARRARLATGRGERAFVRVHSRSASGDCCAKNPAGRGEPRRDGGCRSDVFGRTERG
jgi:hypothetical protein